VVVSASGSVISASLTRSSGFARLDNEAVAVIKRASPFPKPPAGLLQGGQVSFNLPVNFNIKQWRMSHR